MTQTLSVNAIGTTKSDVDIPEPLTVLEDGQIKQAGFGCFRLISAKFGDQRIIWRKESIPDINAAKQMFTDLVKKGMVPYLVGLDGRATATVMQEFDPTAEEVIFLPMKAVVGG